MLLQRGTFCEAYVAQARVFRTYSSWVLTMLLSKVRMIGRSSQSPNICNLQHGGCRCRKCIQAYLCPHRLAFLCSVGTAHAQLSPAGRPGCARTHSRARSSNWPTTPARAWTASPTSRPSSGPSHLGLLPARWAMRRRCALSYKAAHLLAMHEAEAAWQRIVMALWASVREGVCRC